jgi:RND family efflux transporter MFP subunit
MTLKKAVIVAASAAVVALAGIGCTGRSEGKETKSGRPPVAVEVATVAAATLSQNIDVVGTLEPKFSTDIKSEFTAIVTEVYVTQWVLVDRGTPLAKLDTRESEAVVQASRAAVRQAEVAETRATRELERTEKLKQYGLATQQNLDDARSAQEAAAAVTQAARAEFGLAETRSAKALIRSPMAGVIAMRAVNVGDRVENMGGGPMFRIVDNRVLDLTVDVSSARSAEVKVGQALDFTVNALPGKVFAGHVSHINPSADPTSRTMRVMAEVSNPDGELRGGSFAKGRIHVGERSGILQIPRIALLSWDVEHNTGEVFVVIGDTAERRTVKTGEATAELVEVVEGLAAGDKVVTRGGFNIRAGDRVQLVAPQGA